MDGIRITKEQARKFIVLYQGLYNDYQYKDKQGVLDFIEKVGCLQFDTLNVVGRNPDLVLQSRIKNYKPNILQELLYKDRILVDEWDKEMSIYPSKDWPFFERNRKAAYKRYSEIQAIKDYLPYVRDVIERSGPITSSDLKLDEIVDWSWAPTRLSRAALESMYLWGELIIYSKTNSRKLYDFTHKHIAQKILDIEDPNKTLEQYHDWHVLRRIGAVGLLWNKSGDAWLGIKEMKAKERSEAIERLLERKQVMEIQVEDIKYPLYMKSEYQGLLNSVIGQESKARGAILAPLDNMLWDRKLIKELFDFEYRWEVYKPAVQRKYGYYVLPILYGSEFVARFEPVIDKDRETLVIKNWWWESEVKVTAKMRKELLRCIKAFQSFTETKNLCIADNALTVNKLEWLLD
jgi:uncharacterized protein YcaQ